ncbi:hypothetical protein [Leptospira stimsonii]|uniref:Uncharacterized protein n=1 Tax=Leptospira stimsonii TaxID=2202203 RepID=A0A4R9L4L7_9LEPT|nr:hypothetical protein [Leptospira stimsonii]RHX88088.1 hypothetical protein DLM78_03770 [Leptospira stimsonii]TGK23795.1 hypothetical protein EHO98_03800 [Leptospira stimsonii]TGM10497.1 hypothetical protein EHQ90_18720 [Leptospira stimsonii]
MLKHFTAISALLLLLANCKTVSEKAGNISAFSNGVEDSWLVNKPVETTPEIGDKIITGEASGTTFLGFKTKGDTISGNILVHLVTLPLKITSYLPFVGKPPAYAWNGVHGRFADNLEDLAARRAIFANGADGIYITNMQEVIDEGLFTRTVTVTVSGRPIKTKYLGIVSDARIQRIHDKVKEGKILKSNQLLINQGALK